MCWPFVSLLIIAMRAAHRAAPLQKNSSTTLSYVMERRVKSSNQVLAFSTMRTEIPNTGSNTVPLPADAAGLNRGD